MMNENPMSYLKTNYGLSKQMLREHYVYYVWMVWFWMNTYIFKLFIPIQNPSVTDTLFP